MSTDPTRSELEAFAERVLGHKATPKRLREWTAPEPSMGLTSVEALAVGADLDAESLDIAAAQRKLARFTSTAHRTFTSLEDAAMFLLRVLDPVHVDQVLDAARELQEPVWVVMMGAVVRNADLRELFAGEMSPDWRNRPEQIEPAAKVALCKFPGCDLHIPNPVRGQLYCCSGHGSGKQEHSAGCPAAELAEPPVRAPRTLMPGAERGTDTAGSAAPSVVIADGYCQADGCGIKIVNHRRGQPFCCNAHGVGHPEHSDTCLSAHPDLAPEEPEATTEVPIGDESDPGADR